VIFSYVPTLIICLLTEGRKSARYVLPSILLLFLCQHAVFAFAHPIWGYSFNSDSINDLHVASVISEKSHFELGEAGYTQRKAYSYYPMLHLFSVFLNQISGLPLSIIALFFIPFLNAMMVPIFLYYLFNEFFGLEDKERNIAVLFFSMGWYYTYFYSQFIREVYAFPLVLLCLWIAVRTLNNPSRQYAILLPLVFSTTIMAHNISSYVLLAILAIITLGSNISHKNGRLNKPFFLMVMMLLAYTSFVVFDFTIRQVTYSYEGLRAIFTRDSFSLMKPYETWRQYLAYGYYAIIGILACIGGFKLLKLEKIRKNREVIMVIAFFGLSFILCVLLRLSTPAHPWSWTYYMSLRGTIWAFIGLSVLVAFGIKHGLKLGSNVSSKSFFALLLIICVLAAGKFSQYPLIISDSTITPDVTYLRYTATLWLKNETVHGSNMLVAPYTSDIRAFDGARCMAPYAYLKEYFLDEAAFDKFVGYIPFISEFYDQYKNLSNVQIIYSNGDTEIGYKEG
jgi:hypothetical protein